ncbi:MAG: hypothetical protein AAFX80_04190 [Cyanobacteria bacterium J06639_18]
MNQKDNTVSSNVKKNTNNTNNKTTKKGRVIVITGDKGGTGKSVFARILLDVYRHRNIDCIAYECDQSNPQLYRYYNKVKPGVNTLSINSTGGFDILINNIKQYKPSISLLDLPAGAAEHFERLTKDIRLFQNSEKCNYKITTISVLGRITDSVIQLKRLMDFCGDNVNHIVVRNLYWGSVESFIRYNNSKVRQDLIKSGVIELTLPELFDDLFDILDYQSLTFREALKDDVLDLAHQSRLFNWVDEIEEEFNKAADLLGLDNDK